LTLQRARDKARGQHAPQKRAPNITAVRYGVSGPIQQQQPRQCGHLRRGDKRMLTRQQIATIAAIVASLVIAVAFEIREASQVSHAIPNQRIATKQEQATNSNLTKETAEEAIARYNKYLAIFTGILAVAIVGLGLATIGLYLAGEKQIAVAKESADAAKLNAQALIEVERAHLFIVVRSDNVHIATRGVRFYGDANSANMHDAQIMPPALEFAIRNTGRSAAIMHAVSYQLVQAMADNIHWDFAFRDTIVNPVLLANSETEPPTPCELRRTWTIRDGIDAVSETRPLSFFGFVTFTDTFKMDRQYFWRYQYQGGRFVLVWEDEQSPQA
jgi:hypothetical protein